MGRMPGRCGGLDPRRGLHRLAGAAALLAVLAGPPAAAPLQAQTSTDSATYTATFEGNWTTDSTPGGVVSTAHFTTLIGAVHNAMVTFWAPGGMATAGVEQVAELGATSTFRDEIEANMNAVSVIMQTVGGAGTGRATFQVTVTKDHPLVTLLSMIGPSPDWFVGISGQSLLDTQGQWLRELEIDLFPYDAGTEEGTEFSLSNPATSPQQAIASIRNTGKFSGVRMARLTFVRTDPPPEDATVAVESGSAAEGSPVSFTVTLSEAVSENVVLSWSTGDDATPDARQATADTDYTAVSGGSVTIQANQRTATFQVTTLADTDLEGDETFAVTVTAGTLPAGVAIATPTATGTIVDDDATVAVESGSAQEGSPVPFTVRLSNAVGEDVVLGWSTGIDATSGARQATAGTDYTAVSSDSVTITAGQETGTFEVATLPDTDVEGDETFAVTVTAGTLPAGVTIATSTAAGTIVDEDRVVVSLAPGSAPEDSAVQFTARLSKAVGADVVLSWSTADDTRPDARQATAGTDYTAVSSGSVTITAGQETATFEVAALADDVRVEGDETFAVTVAGSTLPAGVTVPAGTQAVGTIQDADRAMVTVASAEAVEGRPIEFRVTLSDAVSPEDVVVWWRTADDATPGARRATADADYMAAPDQRVMIPAGETRGLFEVMTRTDDESEDAETFAVVLTGGMPEAKVEVPADTRAVGRILDAPGPQPHRR